MAYVTPQPGIAVTLPSSSTVHVGTAAARRRTGRGRFCADPPAPLHARADASHRLGRLTVRQTIEDRHRGFIARPQSGRRPGGGGR
jgi:hypothetical protein